MRSEEGRYVIGSFSSIGEAKEVRNVAQMLLNMNQTIMSSYAILLDSPVNSYINNPVTDSESIQLMEENEKLLTDIKDIDDIIQFMENFDTTN